MTSEEGRAREAARALHHGPRCAHNERTGTEPPQGCAICLGSALTAFARAETAVLRSELERVRQRIDAEPMEYVPWVKREAARESMKRRLLALDKPQARTYPMPDGPPITATEAMVRQIPEGPQAGEETA